MASVISTYFGVLEFFRGRTLALVERVAGESDPQEALGWRPGPGRAHVGWQLMHIGVTEELFATERLAPHKTGDYQELWPRFRGGSAPDDNIPTLDEIRSVLAGAREHLLETLSSFQDSQLGEIVMVERQLTLQAVLNILTWHEAHHQGQSHLTLNLRAQRA